MTFMASMNCMCCLTAAYADFENMTKEQLLRLMWHCEYCWDKYHNGEKDKDWLNEEEYMRVHLNV